MDFYIENIEFGKPPAFDDLVLKGYYSLDSERNIKLDCSELKYYKERKNTSVHLDLNDGIEHARHYADLFNNTRLDKIIQWIEKNHKIIEASPRGEKWLKPDFILRRGTIEKLLKTPCDQKEGWIICAMKWRGTIYTCKFDTEETIQWKKNRTPQQKRGTCWGHKFEQYILTDTADGFPDVDKPVDQNSQFCGIFQSRVGNHSLLYSAELDGLCSNKTMRDPLPLDNLEFIELKTSRDMVTTFHHHTFGKYTSHSWWCQCVPVGIKDVLCGFRDAEGIVKELKTYSLDDLTTKFRIDWSPSASMHFMNNFLTHVSKVVINDCDTTIYKFERFPYKDFIEVTEIQPSSEEYYFLPKSYTQMTV